MKYLDHIPKTYTSCSLIYACLAFLINMAFRKKK